MICDKKGSSLGEPFLFGRIEWFFFSDIMSGFSEKDFVVFYDGLSRCVFKFENCKS